MEEETTRTRTHEINWLKDGNLHFGSDHSCSSHQHVLVDSTHPCTELSSSKSFSFTFATSCILTRMISGAHALNGKWPRRLWHHLLAQDFETCYLFSVISLSHFLFSCHFSVSPCCILVFLFLISFVVGAGCVGLPRIGGVPLV